MTTLPGLGRRPAVVVSSRAVNVRLRQPVVARITATERTRALPTFVRVGALEAGLEQDGYILCHDLSTVPAAALGVRLGLLPHRRMAEVDEALRRSLDLV